MSLRFSTSGPIVVSFYTDVNEYCHYQDMAVPVIAVLTKYEALIGRVKDRAKESGGRPVTKKDVMSYLEESVLCPIKKTAHPPAAYVQTHRRYL